MATIEELRDESTSLHEKLLVVRVEWGRLLRLALIDCNVDDICAQAAAIKNGLDDF